MDQHSDLYLGPPRGGWAITLDDPPTPRVVHMIPLRYGLAHPDSGVFRTRVNGRTLTHSQNYRQSQHCLELVMELHQRAPLALYNYINSKHLLRWGVALLSLAQRQQRFRLRITDSVSAGTTCTTTTTVSRHTVSTCPNRNISSQSTGYMLCTCCYSSSVKQTSIGWANIRY